MKGLKNEDREIWRETPDDYYSPSIHVTKNGKVGINCAGHVIVLDVREWHAAQKLCQIYFDIAAEAIGEDAVRQKRDERINHEQENSRGNNNKRDETGYRGI